MFSVVCSFIRLFACLLTCLSVCQSNRSLDKTISHYKYDGKLNIIGKPKRINAPSVRFAWLCIKPNKITENITFSNVIYVDIVVKFDAFGL